MAINPPRALVILAVWLSMISPAAAQQLTGSVAGHVKDAAGALMPGVTVTLAAGNWVATQVTDEDGAYRVIDVPPGIYTAWFRLQAFKNAARQQIAVASGIQSIADGQLQATEGLHYFQPSLPADRALPA